MKQVKALLLHSERERERKTIVIQYVVLERNEHVR